MEDFLARLRRVNGERLKAWCDNGEEADGMFHAVELGGEVGELLNVVKKLHREESSKARAQADRTQVEKRHQVEREALRCA